VAPIRCSLPQTPQSQGPAASRSCLFTVPSGISKTDWDEGNFAPDGGPSWVTLRRLVQTVKVWQPYCPGITIDDAYDLLLSAGRLARALAGGDEP
jgi:hypothetical protein